MRVVQLIAAVGLLLLATTAVHASLPPSGSAKLRNTADCNGYDCIDAGLPLTVPATDAGCPPGYSWEHEAHDHDVTYGYDDAQAEALADTTTRKLQATDDSNTADEGRRHYYGDPESLDSRDYSHAKSDQGTYSHQSRSRDYPHHKPMCHRCDADTFSPGGRSKVCTACGPNQWSRVASPSRGSCSCINGYGRDPQGGCSLCPLGSFWQNREMYYGNDEDSWEESLTSGLRGVQPCITCNKALGGNATTLRPGAWSVKECICNPGFGGPRCRICPAGTWSPGGDKNQPRPSCLTCPKTTIGSPVPGSDNITDCGGCKAGFGWNDCRVCPPNTFSTGGTYAPCVPCGANQVSPPGSPSSNWCQCTAGNGLPVTVPPATGCSTCPLGTFWGGPNYPQPHHPHQHQHTQHDDDRNNHHGQDRDGHYNGNGHDNNRDGYGGNRHDNNYDSQYNSNRHDHNYGGHFDGDRHDSSNDGQYNSNHHEFDHHDGDHDNDDGHHDDTYFPWINPNIGNPPGPQPCISCSTVFPNGQSTTLFPGSMDGSDCVCSPGYGGLSCQICPAGTYSEGGIATDRQRECKTCPQNMIGSAAGATSLFACGGCVAGFGGRDCQPCPPNTYSAGGSYAACTPCGVNQISPAQSPSQDYCECSSGYGLEGGVCRLCPKGTFSAIPPWAIEPHKRENENIHVRLSSVNTPRAQQVRAKEVLGCISCMSITPFNARGAPPAAISQLPMSQAFTTKAIGSTTASDCVCQPGFGGAFCTPCTSGTYSPGGSIAECRTCPSGINSLTLTPFADGAAAVAPTDCACKPGFGLTEKSDQCTVCQPGSFSTGGALAPCELCPMGMSSGLGAKSRDDCFCNTPGWGTIPGETDYCRPCPVGYYSAQIRGKRECLACAPGYTTLQPKSGDITACVCEAGYGSYNGADTCEPCIAPFYQGNLNGFGVPVTGATSVNPFPGCLSCSGTDGSPSIQVTGSINKVCTAGTQLPSAYCSVAQITAQGAPISFTDPITTPACGPGSLPRTFVFNGGVAERIVLPKGIISMRAELAGAAGAAGVRCTNGTCTKGNAGGRGGKLLLKNLETIFQGGEELYVLVGGAALAAAANQSVAGNGGGFTALLSGAEPSAASTVWYAAAGGGGGGAGSLCLPGGICLGASAAGEGGCASDLITMSPPTPGAPLGARNVAVRSSLDFNRTAFMGQKGDNVAENGSWSDSAPAQHNATRVAPTVPAQLVHGGRGGSCLATVVNIQKVQPTALAGSNAGDGYVKLVIVASEQA